MKERVLFIASLIGTFSATIVLLLNHALVLAGIDTSGYADTINLVGMVLAVVILVVAVIFFNKYATLQQKQLFAQNNIVTTALDGNASLMQTLLPDLANQILTAAENRATKLLQSTEQGINNMMNEMLPALAEQTMQVVTQKSQDIVEQTTAKANATMDLMNELIPTYSKQISDAVAQTVRENNAHYHKMLTEIKTLFTEISASTDIPNSTGNLTAAIEDLLNRNQTSIEKIRIEFEEAVSIKLAEFWTQQSPIIQVATQEPIVEEPIVEEPTTKEDVFTVDTSIDEIDKIDEKSDESNTV